PLAWSLDHVGIFARSVADIDVMLNVMTESSIEPSAVRTPFRVGVVRDFFYEHATKEARSLNDRLADRLASAGLHVEEARVPGIFDLQQAILRTILRAETSSIHEDLFTKHAATYGPKLRALIETGMLIDASDYIRARRLRGRYQREMTRLFEKFDV